MTKLLPRQILLLSQWRNLNKALHPIHLVSISRSKHQSHQSLSAFNIFSSLRICLRVLSRNIFFNIDGWLHKLKWIHCTLIKNENAPKICSWISGLYLTFYFVFSCYWIHLHKYCTALLIEMPNSTFEERQRRHFQQLLTKCKYHNWLVKKTFVLKYTQ